jgi:hypothetical protein
MVFYLSLVDTWISENTGNWDLDKGNVISIDYGYDCVKEIYTYDIFE